MIIWGKSTWYHNPECCAQETFVECMKVERCLCVFMYACVYMGEVLMDIEVPLLGW